MVPFWAIDQHKHWLGVQGRGTVQCPGTVAFGVVDPLGQPAYPYPEGNTRKWPEWGCLVISNNDIAPIWVVFVVPQCGWSCLELAWCNSKSMRGCGMAAVPCLGKGFQGLFLASPPMHVLSVVTNCQTAVLAFSTLKPQRLRFVFDEIWLLLAIGKC